MEPFVRLSGIAAPLRRDNVDTDAIIPSVETRSVSRDGYGEKLFSHWRYLAGTRDENPDFVLNRPPFRGASVLLAGRNFGCGSSREAAVWSLAQFGIRCVVAPSFGEIFRSNCVRNGVLPAIAEAQALDALAARIESDPASAHIDVDLRDQMIVLPDGSVLAFEIARLDREMLLAGKNEIELTLAVRPMIASFEKADRAARPWVHVLSSEP